MPINALGTVAVISVATVLFVVPLVIKYHIYRPSVKPIIVGDIVRVEHPSSTLCCEGVLLESESPFETHFYDSEPAVDERDREQTVLEHRALLPDRAKEYWGFHLLRGSSVELSVCARLIGGDVTVVKGHSGLHKCLSEHHRRLVEEAESDEVSESESDEDTSSISSSQGAVLNDTEELYRCKNSLRYEHLPPSYRCSHDLTTAVPVLSLDIEETDYYYFIFASKTYLEIIPNELFAQFFLERTHYDLRLSSGNCSSGRDCSVDMALSSDRRIVVQMERVNNTLMSEELRVHCRPRQWFFFMFYAAFFLVVFICAFQ